MLKETRQSNFHKICNIVGKADNVIDKVEISKSNIFKMYAIAGLIDQKKFNKSLECMTEEENREANDAINQTHLPADIIISDTIPIKHLEIIVDDKGDIYRQRVHIFDKQDWIHFSECYDKETLEEEYSNRTTFDSIDISSVTIVGAITLSLDRFVEQSETTNNPIRTMTIPIIYVMSENKPVLAVEASHAYCQFVNLFMPFGTDRSTNMAIYNGCEWAMATLNTWYSIEVSLLNPLINYRTANKQIVIPQTKTRSGKKKTPAKIKYYKTIYIEDESLDQFFEEKKNESGEINRHCLMWYVTGHWRHYTNGKKVFIQGYWKGEGRFSGIEAETRQRELVLDENDLPKERVPKPKEPARRLFVDSSYDEHVHCECGQMIGSDHLAERCEKCGTLVMYRN